MERDYKSIADQLKNAPQYKAAIAAKTTPNPKRPPGSSPNYSGYTGGGNGYRPTENPVPDPARPVAAVQPAAPPVSDPDLALKARYWREKYPNRQHAATGWTNWDGQFLSYQNMVIPQGDPLWTRIRSGASAAAPVATPAQQPAANRPVFSATALEKAGKVIQVTSADELRAVAASLKGKKFTMIGTIDSEKLSVNPNAIPGTVVVVKLPDHRKEGKELTGEQLLSERPKDMEYVNLFFRELAKAKAGKIAGKDASGWLPERDEKAQEYIKYPAVAVMGENWEKDGASVVNSLEAAGVVEKAQTKVGEKGAELKPEEIALVTKRKDVMSEIARIIGSSKDLAAEDRTRLIAMQGAILEAMGVAKDQIEGICGAYKIANK